MLTFLSPAWLLPLLPLVTLGLFVLWRGRHQVQRVSSTWLWRGLLDSDKPAAARSLDPLWALLLLAAVLAVLALARPAWAPRVVASALPQLDLAIRGLAGDPQAQLFVRGCAAWREPSPLTLDVVAGDKHRSYQLDGAALRAGAVLADIPATAEIAVNLRRGPAVTAWHFRRADVQPFAILRAGAAMPALERIMTLQPGARVAEAILRPALWLIDDVRFSETDFDPGSNSVVIVSARTPIRGVVASTAPGAALPADATAAEPQIAGQSPLLAAVSLQDVRVFKYSRVMVSDNWKVLVTVDGHPWLATRSEPQRHTLWVWMGSELTPSATNWPLDPSFVVFFTNVAAHLRENETPGAHAIDWIRQIPAQGDVAGAGDRSYALSPILLAIASVMIMGLMVLVVRRG